MYTANESCLRCPANCETCLPVTDEVLYPCRTCFIGHGFEPSPKARQTLDNSTNPYIMAAIGSGTNTDNTTSVVPGNNDKVQTNDTSAEFDDPFTWFVGGMCGDCHLIGKHPTFGNNRLRLTPASQFTPYEGRLEVFYSGSWWAVCDDLWNMINTHIACWELGLGLGVSFYYEYYQMPPSVPLDPIPIAFDNVVCQPDENSLYRCERSEFMKHNCDVSETLGIKCSGPRHRSICVSQCPVGQWLDPGTEVCRPCSDNCLECVTHPTLCTSCEENTFLETNQSCVSQCLPGYYGDIIKKQCMSCDEDCEMCENGLSGNICLACPFNKVLYNGNCVTTCPNNSYWIQLGIAHCLTVCPLGYYISGSRCELCDLHCNTCVGVYNNCTGCNKGKVLSLPGINGRDLGTCNDSCDRGYYPDMDHTCKICKQSLCEDCYLGGDYCKICEKDFKLQFHVCVKDCDKGLYNSTGVCSESCQSGYYGDAKTRSCVPCASPCKQCIDGKICTECFYGYHLYNGDCVERCDDGYIALSLDEDSNIKLVGSRSELEGLVQVWRNNTWAYICVDNMNILYGQLICEALGLGNILQIDHRHLSERVSSYVYYKDFCFNSQTNFDACLYNNVYSVCAKQVPLLRCSGRDLKFTDRCVQLNTDPCDTSPCPNVTNCQDVSVNNGTSYCQNCPNGYLGDGLICKEVIESEFQIRIIFPPSDVQLLNWPEGLELQLPCVANDMHVVTIQWYKDGLQLQSDAHMRLESSGTLTLFQPVGLPSSGLYMCMVFLHGNIIGSRTYNITVQERIVVISPPSDYIGSGEVILHCGYRGYPPATITWTKDGQILHDDPSYIFAKNGSVIIVAASPDNSGVYQCTARNNFTQDTASASVTISGAPVIVNKVDLTGAPLGKELRIVCEASGGPTPDIYWKINGKDIEWNDRIKVIDAGTLLITTVEQKDAGLYKCIARNILGEDVWITNVTVMDFPSGDIFEKYEETSIGGNIYFNCIAKPDWPTPRKEWYLPGRGHFVESNASAGIFVYNEKVIIGSVVEKDAGNVTCTISNPSGSVTLVAVLVVKVAPRFTVAPRNLTVVESWRSHLPWVIYAIPAASIHCDHPDGIRLNKLPGYSVTERGLYFTPTWPDSEGWYVVKADNSEGQPLKDQAYVHVIRTYPPLSDLTVTDNTIKVPIQHGGGPSDNTHTIADILVVYLGNDTDYIPIAVNPYQINVKTCTNESSCSNSLEPDDTMYRVGIVTTVNANQPPGDMYFTVGDKRNYAIDDVRVFNPELQKNSWYAITVRYFAVGNGVDVTIDMNRGKQPPMVAAINYTYIYTKNQDPTETSTPVWKIIVPVLVILLLITAVIIILLILHKRGYPILHKISYVCQWPFNACKKEESFNLDSPMDVEAYLQQFSPNPSPTHIKISRINDPGDEGHVSAAYIPTEDEIEHMMAIGINYYDDDNWIIQVPEGVLELSVENLTKLKEKNADIHTTGGEIPSTSGITSQVSLKQEMEFSASHVTSLMSNPAVGYSPSSGSSAADSGFNEVLPKPRRLSLSSQKGQHLAREVVNIMKTKHRKSMANIHNTSMTPDGRNRNYTTGSSKLAYIKTKVTDAAVLIGRQFLKLQNSLSRSKRSVVLETLDDPDRIRKEEIKHSGIHVVDVEEKAVNKETFSSYKPPVATRQVFNDDSGESEEDEYIDPTSIVSVPIVTARMKELKEHNLDRIPTPKLFEITTAIVEKTRKESLPAIPQQPNIRDHKTFKHIENTAISPILPLKANQMEQIQKGGNLLQYEKIKERSDGDDKGINYNRPLMIGKSASFNHRGERKCVKNVYKNYNGPREVQRKYGVVLDGHSYSRDSTIKGSLREASFNRLGGDYEIPVKSHSLKITNKNWEKDINERKHGNTTYSSKLLPSDRFTEQQSRSSKYSSNVKQQEMLMEKQGNEMKLSGTEEGNNKHYWSVNNFGYQSTEELVNNIYTDVGKRSPVQNGVNRRDIDRKALEHEMINQKAMTSTSSSSWNEHKQEAEKKKQIDDNLNNENFSVFYQELSCDDDDDDDDKSGNTNKKINTSTGSIGYDIAKRNRHDDIDTNRKTSEVTNPDSSRSSSTISNVYTELLANDMMDESLKPSPYYDYKYQPNEGITTPIEGGVEGADTGKQCNPEMQSKPDGISLKEKPANQLLPEVNAVEIQEKIGEPKMQEAESESHTCVSDRIKLIETINMKDVQATLSKDKQPLIVGLNEVIIKGDAKDSGKIMYDNFSMGMKKSLVTTKGNDLGALYESNIGDHLKLSLKRSTHHDGYDNVKPKHKSEIVTDSSNVNNYRSVLKDIGKSTQSGDGRAIKTAPDEVKIETCEDNTSLNDNNLYVGPIKSDHFIIHGTYRSKTPKRLAIPAVFK